MVSENDLFRWNKIYCLCLSDSESERLHGIIWAHNTLETWFRAKKEEIVRRSQNRWIRRERGRKRGRKRCEIEDICSEAAYFGLSEGQKLHNCLKKAVETRNKAVHEMIIPDKGQTITIFRAFWRVWLKLENVVGPAANELEQLYP